MMDFLKKINYKKSLLILVIVLLAGYVVWDVSLKLVGNFRMQGYTAAVNKMIDEANNENCQPFNIYSGEEEVQLIKVDCVTQSSSGTSTQESNTSETNN